MTDHIPARADAPPAPATRSRTVASGARAALAAGLVAIAVAACGSSATTPSPATAAPSAAGSPAPSSAPATAAPLDGTASAAPSGSVAPSAGAPTTAQPAPELEAMMPTTFDGVAFTSLSSSFPAGGKVGPAFQAILDALGLPPESRSTAKATPQDPNLVLAYVLYRFAGADPAKLLDAFTNGLVTGGVTPAVTKATIGGRDVRTYTPVSIEGHSDVKGTAYIYSSGEYVYMVLAADPAVAEKAVASWPQ
jgi:hypothetical protein